MFEPDEILNTVEWKKNYLNLLKVKLIKILLKA